MNRDKLTELYKKYDLTKDDVFKHKHYLIITRSGIEKIQAVANIDVTYEVIKCERDFAAVKAFGIKGDAKLETFGSCYNAKYPIGNTQSWYVLELAEKRAMSRIVLKMTEFYKYGAMGQDESEEFKKADNGK